MTRRLSASEPGNRSGIPNGSRRGLLPALLAALLPFLSVFGQAHVPPATVMSGTNVLLISNEALRRRWSRVAVMATPDGRPLEPTGRVAARADAVALDVALARAGELADSARAAMTNAVAALAAVTNQVPESAQHIAVSVPSLGAPNLQGMVVSEGFDGTNDWQVVRFNQFLSVPPRRTVEYVRPGSTSTVECAWDYPWDGSNAEHRCTFPRPAWMAGDMVIRTRRREIFGGPGGLSFGAALVTVDGVPAFTGAVTNGVTGQVLIFDNGVLTRQ